MSTKHTPLPWVVVDPSADNPSRAMVCANGADIYNAPLTDETSANARLIVTAVNSHDDLVEALENVCEWYEAMIQEAERKAQGMFSGAVVVTFGPQREQLNAARAALSKAKGE